MKAICATKIILIKLYTPLLCTVPKLLPCNRHFEPSAISKLLNLICQKCNGSIKILTGPSTYQPSPTCKCTILSLFLTDTITAMTCPSWSSSWPFHLRKKYFFFLLTYWCPLTATTKILNVMAHEPSKKLLAMKSVKWRCILNTWNHCSAHQISVRQGYNSRILLLDWIASSCMTGGVLWLSGGYIFRWAEKKSTL